MVYKEIGVYMLGSFIFDKRNKKGISQEELSNKINVDIETINKWEIDEEIPNAKDLKNLAKELDFSADEALGLKEKSRGFNVSGEIVLGFFCIGLALNFLFDRKDLILIFIFLGMGLQHILKSFSK